jgi:parvulin-like peptidyl-prolyl isomerase
MAPNHFLPRRRLATLGLVASLLAVHAVAGEGEPPGTGGKGQAAALTEHFADRARAAGLADEPRIRFELQQLADRRLERALRRWSHRGVTVPDEQVTAALEKNRAGLVKPERRSMRNLVLRIPPGAGAEERRRIRERLEELRGELLAGADFDRLARRHSESQTRFHGGLFGPIVRGDLAPEIEEVAFGLAVGEVSPVLEVPGAYLLLRCEKVIEARTLSVAEARRRIRTRLGNRLAEERWQALRRELLAAAEPTYHLDAGSPDAGSPDAGSPDAGGPDAGGPDAAPPVVTFRGGRIERRQLPWLAPFQDGRRSPEELTPGELRRLLERYVVRAAAAARARELGLDRDPEEVAAREAEAAELLARRYLERRVDAEVSAPSEEEVRAHFEAHREGFAHPEELDVGVLFLPLEPAAPDPRILRRELDREVLARQLALARELLARIRAGELTFEEAARSHSRHPSAAGGGRLGWTPRRGIAAFGPHFFGAVLELAPGEITEPVIQDYGLWLVKLHGRRPPRPMTYAEAEGAVARKLVRERRRQALDRLLEASRRQLELEAGGTEGRRGDD